MSVAIKVLPKNRLTIRHQRTSVNREVSQIGPHVKPQVVLVTGQFVLLPILPGRKSANAAWWQKTQVGRLPACVIYAIDILLYVFPPGPLYR